MRLREVIDSLLTTALSLPMVKRAERGDVYVNWNAQSGEYGAFNVDIEGFVPNGMFTTANVVLYYGDRLTPDRANEIDLQEDGLNVIQSIINLVQNNADENSVYLSFGDYTATPFTQQFSDELAGVYARVAITYKNNIGNCANV